MQLQNLTTKFVGCDFHYFEKIDSTQTEIFKMIKLNKIKDGSLVLADLQTNGIGTHGRKWFTEEDRKHYFFSLYRNKL